MKQHLSYAAAICALLLAACQGDPEPAPSEQGTNAEGEVLGGTISDDMIPLEQLRSQAPLAPRAVNAPGAGASATSEPANEEAGAANATPASETPED